MDDLVLPAQYTTGDVLVRAATVEDIDADKRTVDVRLMRYEHEVEVDEGLHEMFTAGAFKAAVGNPSRVKVSDQQHQRAVVIGQATELRDESDALYGRLMIADTVAGRDTLTLLREKILEELSIEFRAMKRYMKVNRSTKGLHVRHDRAVLVGISPVAAGAYGDGSRVLAVRCEMEDRQRDKAIASLMAMTSGTDTLAGYDLT